LTVCSACVQRTQKEDIISTLVSQLIVSVLHGVMAIDTNKSKVPR